jgi:uncharacterized protein
MPNLFYSRLERRPRALWRLLITSLIFFALLMGLQMAVQYAAMFLIQSIGGLDMAAAQSILRGHPLLRIAGGAISILATWLSFVIAARWLDRRPISDFGFRFNRAWWRDLVFGLVLGGLLMALVFVVELAAGWIEITGYTANAGSEGFAVWIITALLFFISVGIYEEMLFRGYYLRNIAEGLEGHLINPRRALLLAFFLSSAFFGVAHAANPNATFISSFNIAIAGLFLGIGYLLTKNLAIPIGLHITWNFFQGNVFGFPVSGSLAGATFIEVNQVGPELITGGAFGPEAGLTGLAAMLLGLAATIWWVKYTSRAVCIQDELAVYSPQLVEQTHAAAELQPQT